MSSPDSVSFSFGAGADRLQGRRSVVGMRALAVVGENLDDAALVDAAVAAAFHHGFQLGLQRPQAADALLDLDEAGLGNGVGRGTGLVRIVLQGE
jgi:hypothetical protein